MFTWWLHPLSLVQPFAHAWVSLVVGAVNRLARGVLLSRLELRSPCSTARGPAPLRAVAGAVSAGGGWEHGDCVRQGGSSHT
jgi:hypothetical protein